MTARTATLTGVYSVDSRLAFGATDLQRRQTAAIAHIAFFTCLCMQRFGLQAGQGYLSISLPVLLGLVAWMLVTGKGKFYPGMIGLFLIFAAWSAASTIGALLWPDVNGGISFFSLFAVLITYLMFTVRPSPQIDGATIQRVFLFYVRLCAVLGIVQFLLQFAGIRLYSFTQLAPVLKPILIESNFAFDPVLEYGSEIRRSNGFFLLEASIFSQVLAIAVLLDYFILGRRRYLPLYAVAYMTSFSGTGLLSLIVTLGLVGMASRRNFSRVMTIGAAGIIAGALFAVAYPTQFGVFAGRVGEIGASGTSGNARFVAQGEQIKAVIGETRSLIGYGPGATVRSKYWTKGSGNPALQMYFDYGLIGLLLFYFYFIRSLWSRRYAALSIILIVLFQLGGGYLQFAPFTLLFAALGIWSCGIASASQPAPRNLVPSRKTVPNPRPWEGAR